MRLIDVDDAIEKINCLCVDDNENWIGTENQSFVDHADVIDILSSIPTVDAVPVVHGRWRARDIIAKQAGYGQRYYNHAECKVNPCELFKDAYDYCPSCGAKMDGGENNV